MLTLQGSETKNWYIFKKRFVTNVDNRDAETFLEMTSDDISWCPTQDKSLPPFMKLKDWCKAKEGRVGRKPLKIYKSKKYKKLFLLKEQEK